MASNKRKLERRESKRAPKKAKLDQTVLPFRPSAALESLVEELDDDLDVPQSKEMNSTEDPSFRKIQLPTKTEKTRVEKERKKEQKVVLAQAKNKNKFSFLDNPKDASGRDRNDIDYDPRTLFIPPAAFLEMTEFEKQYWKIKQKCFDTIVFFKKGKFFEMFETDAEVAMREFGLKMTDRVSMRMCGIPVSSFEEYVAKFIRAGYKVAKVEQTETPLSKRIESSKGQDVSSRAILNRELSKIITPGTLVDENLLVDHNSVFLLGIKQMKNEFGIAFVDTAVGEFNLGKFTDDWNYTNLKTFLFRFRPREIVFLKGDLDHTVLKLIKHNIVAPVMNQIKPDEGWSFQTTLDALRFEGYFQEREAEIESYPTVLQKYINEEATMTALGLVTGYLRELKMDRELVSQKKFQEYLTTIQDHLVLDAKCLANLEIIENTLNMGYDGTLLSVVNRCVTPFGKRLMKRWLCHPLSTTEKIDDRLLAVDNLGANFELRDQIERVLTQLPDLERMMSRVHAKSSKLEDLLQILDAFEKIIELIFGDVQNHIESFTSNELLMCLSVSPTGSFPDIKADFVSIINSFQREESRKLGRLVPNESFDAEYDQLVLNVKTLEESLQAILKKQQKYFKSTKVVFKDLGKEPYQIEVPNDILDKIPAPDNWKPMSKPAKVTRFYLPKVQEILPKLEEARYELEYCQSNLLNKFINKIDERYPAWAHAIECLAQLDCLLSISKFSTCSEYPTLCRPSFVDSPSPFLQINTMYHPTLANRIGETFIANNVQLGIEGDPNIILITGPNMGGKSTILRTIGTLVVLAQLGCYVPCESFLATPVDRIFTRLGATDNIFEGQSTFMVELAETAAVLNEGTVHSLVLLDELGRGTSTFDGYSIAYAVLQNLSRKGCRTLFATHYHLLTDELSLHPGIALKHMAVLVDENASEDDVVFLYQLVDGVCPKSYGMRVAQMAGLPLSLRQRATEKANEFEHSSLMKYLFFTPFLTQKTLQRAFFSQSTKRSRFPAPC